MKATFWIIIHNIIAHPLLMTGRRWAERFHDWTFAKYEAAEKEATVTFKRTINIYFSDADLKENWLPIYKVEVETLTCGIVFKSHGNACATEPRAPMLKEVIASIETLLKEQKPHTALEILIVTRSKVNP